MKIAVNIKCIVTVILVLGVLEDLLVAIKEVSYAVPGILKEELNVSKVFKDIERVCFLVFLRIQSFLRGSTGKGLPLLYRVLVEFPNQN